MRTGLVIALAILALAVAARGLERRTTWYLASDQFAFLTFADDLRHGTVFHDPTIVRRLSPDASPPPIPVDALFQTYIYDDGRLYSRYPPGFPLLLAAAGVIGGEPAQHLLNPVLYLALLLALGAGVRQLAGAGAGVAVMWALLVVPAEVHYWGITVARDLPAHLLALVALWSAWRGHTTGAALVLGAACSIRPDAALWGLGVAAVAPRRTPRALVVGAIAFLVGLAPLLAYNTVTQGHPFAFTQGMEFRHVLAGLLALPASLVSGGGFRLAHLPATLPVHFRYLWDAFGLLLVPAVCTLVGAVRRRTAVAGAFGPYAVVAFVFYSCWGHGDARYLVGVALCLLALAAIGVADWCRALSATTWRRRLVATAIVVMAIATTAWWQPASRARAVERAIGGAAIASLALPPPLAAIAPAAGMATLGLVRIAYGSGTRDPFQEPQVDRARAAVEALVPSGALVLTTPALGRPGENITHYTHADAHYLGETTAMRSSPQDAARTVLSTGDRVFLLLGVLDPLPFAGDVREVARRDGATLHDWFADPQRAPLGAVLYEVLSVPPRFAAR